MSVYENWEEYDHHKIQENGDKDQFSCDEPWEVNYLINKVRTHYPAYTQLQVKHAITLCCSTIKTPRVRKEFIECVLKHLQH
jgi:hypothetical protein